MRTYKAALGVLVAAVLAGGASASPRIDPVEYFTANVGIFSSPARFELRAVDIAIMRWSTPVEHQMLAATLLEKGWVEYLDQLCTFEPVGSIVTLDGRDIAIRYAWQVTDREGRRRVFIGTDEPIVLVKPPIRPSALADSLTFLELRLDANGKGEGKFSEAARLMVDESENVIQLRDYANRPLHMMMVRSLFSVEE